MIINVTILKIFCSKLYTKLYIRKKKFKKNSVTSDNVDPSAGLLPLSPKLNKMVMHDISLFLAVLPGPSHGHTLYA